MPGLYYGSIFINFLHLYIRSHRSRYLRFVDFLSSNSSWTKCDFDCITNKENDFDNNSFPEGGLGVFSRLDFGFLYLFYFQQSCAIQTAPAKRYSNITMKLYQTPLLVFFRFLRLFARKIDVEIRCQECYFLRFKLELSFHSIDRPARLF